LSRTELHHTMVQRHNVYAGWWLYSMILRPSNDCTPTVQICTVQGVPLIILEDVPKSTPCNHLTVIVSYCTIISRDHNELDQQVQFHCC
jgi:hypothetical protein